MFSNKQFKIITFIYTNIWLFECRWHNTFGHHYLCYKGIMLIFWEKKLRMSLKHFGKQLRFKNLKSISMFYVDFCQVTSLYSVKVLTSRYSKNWCPLLPWHWNILICVPSVKSMQVSSRRISPSLLIIQYWKVGVHGCYIFVTM